ncbi:MAG TPA: hypothetical protein DCE42_12720 [Myxococcales bacterium]|nr:hypothetical protein [Deltaproteobacteria bacterium]MBU54122.1 hypothetical protein [Deltaproteobacteria bacterium]HAA55617.1 hypothetical protein [Myxococcales bacterium]|tara:strand:- start:11673 stop:12092 length:420 start_codon:yes stop_codon:yes gene_type:complete
MNEQQKQELMNWLPEEMRSEEILEQKAEAVGFSLQEYYEILWHAFLESYINEERLLRGADEQALALVPLSLSQRFGILPIDYVEERKFLVIAALHRPTHEEDEFMRTLYKHIPVHDIKLFWARPEAFAKAQALNYQQDI